MVTLNDLKVTDLSGGWKSYYIQGLSASEVGNIVRDLKIRYHEVYPKISRFKGTAEFYGDIQCCDIKTI